MTVVLTLAVGLLTGAGVYLVLSRRIFPAVLGFALLAHAAHLIVLAAGGHGARPPIVVPGIEPHLPADPVPQAFVLTAIVISMTVTVYLLAVFVASTRQVGSDLIVTPLADDTGRDADEVAAELSGREEEEEVENGEGAEQ